MRVYIIKRGNSNIPSLKGLIIIFFLIMVDFHLSLGRRFGVEETSIVALPIVASPPPKNTLNLFLPKG